jgi:hypothetical protein
MKVLFCLGLARTDTMVTFKVFLLSFLLLSIMYKYVYVYEYMYMKVN